MRKLMQKATVKQTDMALEMKNEVLKFQHQLARLISLLYASALQQVSTMEIKEFELIELQGFESDAMPSTFWRTRGRYAQTSRS